MGKPGRRRRELDEQRIASLVQGGRTCEEIVSQLAGEGVTVSLTTISRRVRELRGLVPGQRSEAGQPLPTEPGQIPDGVGVEQLDRWIRQAETAINDAEKSGNHRLMGTMLRVAASLAETRRKAVPPPVPDPNLQPDMVAAAKKAREALHKLIDSAVDGA